jgi:hypothetical protein
MTKDQVLKRIKGNDLRIKYKPRKHTFEASNLVIDANTMQGWSYDWYTILHYFDKTLVLNTYRYSHSTIKHVYKIMSLLDTLGLKYECLEAPQGLQDLHSSVFYNIKELAKFIVKQKYSKTKIYDFNIKEQRKQLKLLNKLGFPYSKKELELQIEVEEKKRDQRLIQQREYHKKRAAELSAKRKERAEILKKFKSSKYVLMSLWNNLVTVVTLNKFLRTHNIDIENFSKYYNVKKSILDTLENYDLLNSEAITSLKKAQNAYNVMQKFKQSQNDYNAVYNVEVV